MLDVQLFSNYSPVFKYILTVTNVIMHLIMPSLGLEDRTGGKVSKTFKTFFAKGKNASKDTQQGGKVFTYGFITSSSNNLHC